MRTTTCAEKLTPLHQRQMLAGGESKVRRSMPKSDSARGKAELVSRSCSRSLSSGDHRWTDSGRKTTTIPANPASVTATCAAMPRASLGCIATIKGEHGQEINAQIRALEEELNSNCFERSPKHLRPTHSMSGQGPLPSSAMKRSIRAVTTGSGTEPSSSKASEW